jgi:hypothetical protein
MSIYSPWSPYFLEITTTLRRASGSYHLLKDLGSFVSEQQQRWRPQRRNWDLRPEAFTYVFIRGKSSVPTVVGASI